MVVISDTTPLISFLKIGQLDLLEKLYKTVIIPQAVFDELTANKRFPKEAEVVKNCPFLKIQPVEDKLKVATLQANTGLDLGESEAIVLAESINANLLMMDEIRGRTVAKEQGLSVIGVVGILSTAYLTKHLSADEVHDCVEKLQQNRRHIGEPLLNSLLNMVK